VVLVLVIALVLVQVQVQVQVQVLVLGWWWRRNLPRTTMADHTCPCMLDVRVRGHQRAGHIQCRPHGTARTVVNTHCHSLGARVGVLLSEVKRSRALSA
jgi:hypothetical protein